MKAVCILYQMTNNVIKEKVDKDGKTLKSVQVEEKVLTKELLQKFPEFKAHNVPLGSKVKVPNVDNTENLVRVTEYDMEAEFVFPVIAGVDPKIAEDSWTERHTEASKELDDKEDFQNQMKQHLRWFLQEGWAVTGYTGTHFTLELSIEENAKG
jgi:hypothetical protein